MNCGCCRRRATRFGSFVGDLFGASGLDLPRATVVAMRLEMSINLLEDGPLSDDPSRSSVLQFPDQASVHQEIAGRIADRQRADRNPHAEEPRASPVVQRFIDCAREVAKPLARRN